MADEIVGQGCTTLKIEVTFQSDQVCKSREEIVHGLYDRQKPLWGPGM